jgi:hypothetical protein
MLPPRSANQLKSGRKKNVEAHTSPTKYGMGDYYGTGFKAPVGRVRDGTVGFIPVSKSKLGKPPKSVV